ncbi:PREDICTED: uncharacterized protein LOC104812496 [Tarenaya hassleriana]|uniref:uncharacterized protein LOC104812496 n=1 Tax=Tarenaya hassleriana TaxID=28532 RepID=UPI00053C6551|nr:PREDICTED: uncharacterized protein LOC104812496 [Tarenaya hassleriana]
MANSKKWASLISVAASFVFCVVVVFQVPLFRVPCGNRVCETPLEVVSSQLIRNELVPSSFVKTLLYPGATGKSIISGRGFPSYNKLFKYYSFDSVKRTSFSAADINHLEVLAGSCLCVLGALLSLFKPRRISFIGTLLIFWGLIREIVLSESSPGRTSDGRNSVLIYPAMFLAALSAFLSIRSDVRTIIRSCRIKPKSL